MTAIDNLETLDRSACRQQAEAEYSMSVMGDRLETWFSYIFQMKHSNSSE
ncbi:hypothetical protein [Neosynechococcus sphagnicola]